MTTTFIGWPLSNTPAGSARMHACNWPAEIKCKHRLHAQRQHTKTPPHLVKEMTYLHGDSRVEAQQVLCGLQVDGFQEHPLGLGVLAGIIQGSGQVQHDGGVVLVVLLQGGGVQLDGGRDLALGKVEVGQVDGHIWQVQPVHTSTGGLLYLQSVAK